ncbi:MAG: DUF1906 domain-containing protein [Alphaproteobacteria bacterium]|nr:DUF1906 domain-containing protein [Alphaproteobacteria bacterium]
MGKISLDKGPSRRLFLSGVAALPIAACATSQPSAPGPSSPNAPGTPSPDPSTPTPAPMTAIPSRYPAIIDTATNVQPYLPALKALGVRTIFRYYAQAAQAEVPQKQLTEAEAAAILDAGMSIASVYQYYNNLRENIQGERGAVDGETALARAARFRQPAGSAIYFGIDGDWPDKGADITAYFQAARAKLAPAGYRVGVYGSGATCKLVLDQGLAEFAWLVNSPGHTGAASFYNSGRWTLFQNGIDTSVAGGIRIDTNLLDPAREDFGQWGRPGTDVLVPAAISREVLAGRRFVAAKAARLFAAPDASGAPLASTYFGKGRSVRVLGAGNGWAEVDVNETGRPSGYCRISDLNADMATRPDYFAAG